MSVSKPVCLLKFSFYLKAYESFRFPFVKYSHHHPRFILIRIATTVLKSPSISNLHCLLFDLYIIKLFSRWFKSIKQWKNPINPDWNRSRTEISNSLRSINNGLLFNLLSIFVSFGWDWWQQKCQFVIGLKVGCYLGFRSYLVKTNKFIEKRRKLN